MQHNDSFRCDLNDWARVSEQMMMAAASMNAAGLENKDRLQDRSFHAPLLNGISAS
jgi:hypothetical protein